MHELKFANDLVERASEILIKENAKKVIQINLRMGQASGLDQNELLNSFLAATKHSHLENCKLVIEESFGADVEFLYMEVVS